MSTPQDEKRLVDTLSRFQVAKLTIHSNDRAHWREWGGDEYYLRRLDEEASELRQAVRDGQTPAQVWREAADDADFEAAS